MELKLPELPETITIPVDLSLGEAFSLFMNLVRLRLLKRITHALARFRAYLNK